MGEVKKQMYEKPVISLSTSYLQSKFKGDGYAMLQEAAAMGFEYVELGHSTTIQTVDGIVKAFEEGVVKASSVHNFCPIPPFASGASPNLFSPSTKSKIESGQWLRHTRNTLDFAGIFKAKAMVMHGGSLSYFFARPDAKLRAMLKNREDDDAEEENKEGGENEKNEEPAPLSEDKKYLKLRDKFMERAKRRTEKSDYKNIVKNVSDIHELAVEKGVLIGIENRDGISELPLDWNIEKLFEMTGELANVKGWHDVGHSMRKEQMLLCKQLELIERTKDMLIGWHLHDCTDDGQDHVAIGKGVINFAEISKFFDKQKHIFTLELNYAVKREDAVDSRKRVEDMLS